MIVIDKPAGLIVHPGAGPSRRHAGQRAARTGTRSSPASATRPGPGIVHRLDAQHERAARGRAHAGRVRRARRRARGADGGPRATSRWCGAYPTRASGVIDAPIGRSVRRPTRMAVREGGRAGPDPLRGRAHLRRPGREPAALHARDRAHPPDPRAPRGDQASRSSATRRTAGSGPGIDIAPAVPARRDAGVRAPGHGRAATLRVGAPARPRAGARPARRLTTRSTVRFTIDDAC